MLNKEQFLEHYKNEKAFIDSHLKWKTLEEIYDDYAGRQGEMEACCRQLEEYILDKLKLPIHSIHGRSKSPEHLIEKIIRKRGIEQSYKYLGINKDNYRNIVRDLIGVRVLILSKEEWASVHDWLCMKFPPYADKNREIFMAEAPKAYTRYGDRDIFEGKIYKEHSNKGYRSQHYVVRYNEFYCEIQVRTLSEEVFGEFDHKVKYPYRNHNKFLIRYTNMVSEFLDSVDEMISTCFQMQESGWEHNNIYYKEDNYTDWKKTYQANQRKDIPLPAVQANTEKIEINSYADQLILRKDR